MPWLLLGLVVLVAAGAAAYLLLDDPGPTPEVLASHRPPHAIAMATMGDSETHSYHDRLAFPPGSDARGGAFRERTFGWVETLARLRGNDLDPGPWLEWGTSGLKSSIRRRLGLAVGRIGRKEDFLYNFANSGAGCDDLMTGPLRQAPWLRDLMDKEPQRWKNGIVVIRIGLANWIPLLGLQAENPNAPEVAQVIERCTARFEQTIALLREHHPGLRFLIMGIGNEIDDPGQFKYFQSARETRNIRQALDRYNGAVRAVAERTPGAAYFDTDAWFQRLWGARAADGLPNAYRSVTVGDFVVTNTAGDEPHNALIADLHSGTVWNALLVQALVLRLREAFGLTLAPVSDEELWRYLRPLVRPEAAQPGKPAEPPRSLRAPGS